MARRLIVALLALTGCGDAVPHICDRPATPDPKLYTGGYVDGDRYFTSRRDGEALFFPGGTWYKIQHHLGKTPVDWNCDLSFARTGFGEAGSFARAAGNQAELKAWDDQTFTILNDTCVDFYLLCTVTTK